MHIRPFKKHKFTYLQNEIDEVIGKRNDHNLSKNYEMPSAGYEKDGACGETSQCYIVVKL